MKYQSKYIIVLFFIIGFIIEGYSQKLPDNWYNLDMTNDSVMGVSANRAYNDLLKGKTGVKVIVAVIDNGTDPEHPDLKANIWTNTKEIAGNGIDDDKNGYADDIHGWDFIGGKTGDVKYDQLEKTRIFKKYYKEFELDSTAAKSKSAEYKLYSSAKVDFLKERSEVQTAVDRLTKVIAWMEQLKKDTGKDSITVEDVIAYTVTDTSLNKSKERIIKAMSTGNSYADLQERTKVSLEANNVKLEYHLNPDFDARSIVGDDYEDANQRNYGNNDVKGPEADHGTHVAGSIGAVRGNGIGIDGVADNAQIMIVRVVPDGDERDKDVANAIRYAAENGAKVINMSFGKDYPYNKKAVDEAVQYAISKDVLIIHGAGNDGANLDLEARYPNPVYQNTKGNAWKNWIDVGAVAANGSPAVFSNYGKKYVDLFSPGVRIYSTLPDDKYGNMSGTSMASPVCAGVAVMIRSYFPSLTAAEVKTILMKSVYTSKEMVAVPGKKDTKVKWSKLCKSGGMVNAYNAVQLAQKKSK